MKKVIVTTCCIAALGSPFAAVKAQAQNQKKYTSAQKQQIMKKCAFASLSQIYGWQNITATKDGQNPAIVGYVSSDQKEKATITINPDLTRKTTYEQNGVAYQVVSDLKNTLTYEKMSKEPSSREADALARGAAISLNIVQEYCLSSYFPIPNNWATEKDNPFSTPPTTPAPRTKHNKKEYTPI